MYILEIPHDPDYRLSGTLAEIMESLAIEINSTNRAIDGYEAYLEAVWPTDPSELDEGEIPPKPVEINEASVLDFASKVWDTRQARLIKG